MFSIQNLMKLGGSGSKVLEPVALPIRFDGSNIDKECASSYRMLSLIISERISPFPSFIGYWSKG